jgi:hypothetical protein
MKTALVLQQQAATALDHPWFALCHRCGVLTPEEQVNLEADGRPFCMECSREPARRRATVIMARLASYRE